MGGACKEKAGREAQRRELEWGGGGAQVRVARNDSGAGVGRGKVSAENWRVKEFKRRAEEKNEKKKRLSHKTTPRSPASGGCYVMILYNIYNIYIYRLNLLTGHS